MEWMLLPLKRYADFSGRSRRLEYWMFQLFQWLVMLVMFAACIPFMLASETGDDPVWIFFLLGGVILFYLGMFVPNLAVTWRRMQDQDIEGWVGILLFFGTVFFSPVGIALLVFMCMDGKAHSNRFGPDPKGRGDSDVRDIFA